MAFGHGGALLVVLAHAGIIRASTRLLRRVHSAAAGPAALPLSLFWTGALINYSEPELLAFGSGAPPGLPAWLTGAWAWPAVQQPANDARRQPSVENACERPRPALV